MSGILFYIYKKMVTKKDCIAAEFYSSYIDLVKEDNLSKALKKNTAQVKKLLKKIRTKKVDYAYAEKKWTIKEILQHLIDAERVFAYRAITFARKDTTPLPSFDEKNWAENAKVKKRKWKDLVTNSKLSAKLLKNYFVHLMMSNYCRKERQVITSSMWLHWDLFVPVMLLTTL